MNDDVVQLGLYIFVMAYGLYYVVAYMFRWRMYLPGGVFKPGRDPLARLIVFFLGLAMVVWAGYSLML